MSVFKSESWCQKCGMEYQKRCAYCADMKVNELECQIQQEQARSERYLEALGAAGGCLGDATMDGSGPCAKAMKKRVHLAYRGSFTACGIPWNCLNVQNILYITLDATDSFEYVTCKNCLKHKPAKARGR